VRYLFHIGRRSLRNDKDSQGNNYASLNEMIKFYKRIISQNVVVELKKEESKI